MINNEQRNGYEASELLSTTINLWKQQPTVRNEIRTCILKPIANRAGELTLELSISALLYCNGLVKEVIVNAQPFNTATLGISTKNNDYREECRSLKNLMDKLDEEFNNVVKEQNSHDFKSFL